AVAKADYRMPVAIDPLAHDRPDRGVQARAIATARQHSDPHHPGTLQSGPVDPPPRGKPRSRAWWLQYQPLAFGQLSGGFLVLAAALWIQSCQLDLASELAPPLREAR